MKTGRKSRDLSRELLNANSVESPRNSAEIAPKVNGGGPQPYLNQSDNTPPTSAGSMHLGGQNVSTVLFIAACYKILKYK